MSKKIFDCTSRSFDFYLTIIRQLFNLPIRVVSTATNPGEVQRKSKFASFNFQSSSILRENGKDKELFKVEGCR